MGILTQPLYHSELIDGQEVEKPLPKDLHAFSQTFLLASLVNHLPRRYRAASELNVWCGPDRLVPDVIVMRRNAQYEDGDLIDRALLCIEIMSPGQTLADLLDKCDRILRSGTPTCWVIWPERQKAWTYTTNDLIEEHKSLSLTLPPDNLEPEETVAISLTDLWAELNSN